MSEPKEDVAQLKSQIQELFDRLAAADRNEARKFTYTLQNRLPAADTRDTAERMAKLAGPAAGKIAGMNPFENPKFAKRAAGVQADREAEEASEREERKAKAKAAAKPAGHDKGKPMVGGFAAKRAELEKKLKGGAEPKSPRSPKSPSGKDKG